MTGAEPIEISVELPVTPAAAYAAFSAGFGDWWPAATHSLTRDPATACRMVLEPGGAVEERAPDGDWQPWGRVEALEPGRRLRFSWHPGREPESAQWVDVAFEPTSAGSRVALVHGGWEALGEIAPILRREYAAGWPHVLDAYAEFARHAATRSP